MRAWTDTQGRRAYDIASSRAGRRVGLVAGVLLFVGIAVRLGLQVHRGELDRVAVDPWPLAGAIAVAAAANLVLAASWRTALGTAGHAARLRDALGILLVAQIAKYIPGGVLQVASRIGIGARKGISARTSGAALLIESGSLVVAGLLLSGLLIVHWALWPLLPLAVISVASLRRARRLARLRPLLAWHLCALALFGLSAYLLFRAGNLGSPAAPHIIGAYAIAWVGGYLVVFAPGGLGVREALFIWVLSGSVGQSAALSVAVASRVVTLTADVLMGLAGIPLLGRTSQTLSHRGSETDQ